ncbi:MULTISPECIES: hypothetical protein [unclassified Pseudoclavibacter]|uniref:hypothetical protein n=1 Tax=unclassified Pseudoclavibacter TaxID=2615177 RepID=UPI001BAC4636|nr:hypothetical protein [Pseudoclavibacter sp. Marseille-Q4354]MBS3180444.1 hypothetical protein [Pseudoclavibacter sp. Marseille-Q4354]
MTRVIRTSARVESLRLLRTGLLLGMIVAFTFFGLSAPVLATHMQEIFDAAASAEQISMTAAAATPADGIALYNQSAMQLGLILSVATAVTSLTWDTRAGSSIFYRTRVRTITALTVPRLGVDCLAAVASYTLGLACAGIVSVAAIGPLTATFISTTWAASTVYLVMSMSIGYLIMTAIRRTAAALAISAVLLLALPLLSQVDAVAAWSPTSLLAQTDLTAPPLLAAGALTVGCVLAAGSIARRQALRRDA